MSDEIDALYDLPPQEFTAARDAVVKRLRAEGDTDAAVEAKGRRRPTLAAWAVNRVARSQPALVQTVVEAGGELQRIQRRMLSGLPDADLRPAMEARRAAVAEAVGAAIALVEEAGGAGAAQRGKLSATFEAASLGGEAGQVVQAGRLERELPPPSGFGEMEGLSLVSGGEVVEERDGAVEERDGAVEQRGGVVEERDDGAVHDRRRSLDDARAAVDGALARADEAVDRARVARRRAEDLRRDVEDAQVEARAREQAATEALRRADALAADLEDAAEDERHLAEQARRRAADVVAAEQRLAELEG